MIACTNGVFDVIHPGHIRLLAFARSLADKLVVYINTDESAKRLKGLYRPIVPLIDRMEVLASIRYVDAIFTFSEDTPERAISELKPDILVKGPEFHGREHEIPGAQYAKAIVTPDWPIEHSTTEYTRRLRFNEPGLELRVDGQDVPVLGEHSIRFVENPTKPVLYTMGRREIRAWELRLVHSEPADKWGRSG